MIINTVKRYYNLRPSRDNSGKHTIHLRARVNGELVELGTTGVKIDLEKNWCNVTKTLKNPDINKDIEGLIERFEASKNFINEVVRYYNREGICLTGQMLKNEFQKALKNKYKFQSKEMITLDTLFEDFLRNQEQIMPINYQKLAHNTFRDYRYKFEKIRQFSIETNIPLSVGMINRTFVSNLKRWLIANFNNTDSSANKYIMRIKVVLNYAVEVGLIDKNPIFEVKTPKHYDTDLRHLNYEQILQLYKHEFHSERIQKVVDMYLFSCVTGICYADQVKLKTSNIDFQKRLIVDYRQKTKTRYTAPLTEIAFSIIQKYGSIEAMPKISNQKANEYLKLALYEIGVPEAFEFTFHSGRKSFVNYCLNREVNPVPAYDLIKMLGHTSIEELKSYGVRSDENVIVSFFK